MAVLNFISKSGGVMPIFDNPYFILADFDGLTRFNALLSALSVPGVDGDTVNNAQAMPRTINLYLQVRAGAVVEDAKNYILQYVKPMQAGTLHFENRGRRVEIEGICEAVDMPRFTANGVTMLISMHCEQPFWHDVDNVLHELGYIVNRHYFPPAGLAFPAEGIPFGYFDYTRTQAITNAGDVAVGIDIQIIAISTVTNPTLYDVTNGGHMKIEDTLNAGDVVQITTHKGNKTVTKNGVNIIDKLSLDSSWLIMPTGDCEFMVDSDDDARDNLHYVLSFRQLYV